jgi:tetratricopeptide (TPR) repeat protein
MDPDGAALDRIELLLRGRNAVAAEASARQFLASRPARVEGHILLGRALQMQGDFAGALSAAGVADPPVRLHPAATLLRIECWLQTGETDRGVAGLRQLERDSQQQHRLLQDIGGLYSNLNLHMDAERCYARAAALRPQDPQALYNWATCLIAIGRLEDAEQLFTRVIALAPADYDAYYNRATLRRQTPGRNHVTELERAWASLALPPAGVAGIGYALAKELEDLGRYADSFAALERAAGARRRMMSYRVEDDIVAMDGIRQSFDAGYPGEIGGVARSGYADRRPIFIVGLPRSGTTLVDRILSSHGDVQSRGESSDLATTVMRLAGPAADKLELIRLTLAIDPAALGQAYCARLPAAGAPRVIDKTPMNFLYLGLIAAALPAAHIIHVRRRAPDVCFAMYKTLFRMAYPFSYDLTDLGRYYLAYADLMQHWRERLGPGLIEVDYESLVADQEASTRRLLAACDLPWEPACLEFHRNQTPSLTASAAQVRQPIHSDSVGLWRRYEPALQPLVDVLRAAGVAIE